MITKKRTRKNSIKLQLITLPLLVVFIAITIIGAVSSWSIRESLLKQTKDDGLLLANKVVSQVVNNSLSLNTINTMLEEKIRTAAKITISNQGKLSSDVLKTVAKSAGVDEIYWYSPQGVIIYSTVDSYMGWKPEKGHPVDNFRLSGKNELMEGIRKDSESDNYNKYGYLKNIDNSFLQVGIRANEVEALTKKFSYQNLVEELVKENSIVYAVFIDKNLKAVAHSDKKRIGIQLTDVGSKTAAVEGKIYSSQFNYKTEEIPKGITVQDVLVPVIVDGKLLGAIDIGISMAVVNSAITKNIMIIAITGILSFVILALFLYNGSNYAIKAIDKLKGILGIMSLGDFTKEIPKELLDKN